ncbi:MAG: hypothetical protein JXN60_08580 [Lentisphaerae bacterium]|nr:hypothetical protein [Lentisphaerota bacterium]
MIRIHFGKRNNIERRKCRLDGFSLADESKSGKYIFYGLDRIMRPRIECATGSTVSSRFV